jgi:hypothetical protein
MPFGMRPSSFSSHMVHCLSPSFSDALTVRAGPRSSGLACCGAGRSFEFVRGPVRPPAGPRVRGSLSRGVLEAALQLVGELGAKAAEVRVQTCRLGSGLDRPSGRSRRSRTRRTPPARSRPGRCDVRLSMSSRVSAVRSQRTQERVLGCGPRQRSAAEGLAAQDVPRACPVGQRRAECYAHVLARSGPSGSGGRERTRLVVSLPTALSKPGARRRLAWLGGSSVHWGVTSPPRSNPDARGTNARGFKCRVQPTGIAFGIVPRVRNGSPTCAMPPPARLQTEGKHAAF